MTIEDKFILELVKVFLTVFWAILISIIKGNLDNIEFENLI